jgi:hypothetical protein
LSAQEEAVIEHIIERLCQKGCGFLISRQVLYRYYNRVGERTMRELARRGMLVARLVVEARK